MVSSARLLSPDLQLPAVFSVLTTDKGQGYPDITFTGFGTSFPVPILLFLYNALIIFAWNIILVIKLKAKLLNTFLIPQ